MHIRWTCLLSTLPGTDTFSSFLFSLCSPIHMFYFFSAPPSSQSCSRFLHHTCRLQLLHSLIYNAFVVNVVY